MKLGFREITEAYHILSNPEKRAQYDATSQKRRKDRWRLVTEGARRRTISNSSKPYDSLCLSALYTKRRVEPEKPRYFLRELERMIGRPREHLEFTIWFLNQKKLINTDDSRMYLTADGAEYLEDAYRSNHPTKTPPVIKRLVALYSRFELLGAALRGRPRFDIRNSRVDSLRVTANTGFQPRAATEGAPTIAPIRA